MKTLACSLTHILSKRNVSELSTKTVLESPTSCSFMNINKRINAVLPTNMLTLPSECVSLNRPGFEEI